MNIGPIGVFDSGFGGLTILKDLQKKLPQYNYLYLGDNARAPYGNRSYNTVFDYTWQCTQFLLAQQCPLIILACNTASAKALRTIQQKYILPTITNNRVLGVIRPTAQTIASYSTSGHIGILATQGTVQSQSYIIEIKNFSPATKVYQQACPMLVPLIENNEHNSQGANYFIQKYVTQLMAQQPLIDVILLGCTHYPLIENKIAALVPSHVKIISQGSIIANSLATYLQNHINLQNCITQNKNTQFFTTDSMIDFDNKAPLFYGQPVTSQHVSL